MTTGPAFCLRRTHHLSEKHNARQLILSDPAASMRFASAMALLLVINMPAMTTLISRSGERQGLHA
jgi:hypothetical protein